jgi:hypothetical protein
MESGEEEERDNDGKLDLPAVPTPQRAETGEES